MRRTWGATLLSTRRRRVRPAVLNSPLRGLALVVEPSDHIDNEYSHAGILDPKIVVTTSRDPSSKLIQFAKVCTLHVSQVHNGMTLPVIGNAPGLPQLSPHKSRKLRCEGAGRGV